jgi:hypothetical protein
VRNAPEQVDTIRAPRSYARRRSGRAGQRARRPVHRPRLRGGLWLLIQASKAPREPSLGRRVLSKSLDQVVDHLQDVDLALPQRPDGRDGLLLPRTGECPGAGEVPADRVDISGEIQSRVGGLQPECHGAERVAEDVVQLPGDAAVLGEDGGPRPVFSREPCLIGEALCLLGPIDMKTVVSAHEVGDEGDGGEGREGVAASQEISGDEHAAAAAAARVRRPSDGRR